MSAVVHSTCPGCKQVLRIPADWLGQAFRCKHCGMVIQARAKASPPEAVSRTPVAKPVAVPVTKPAPSAKRSSGADPFSFEGEEEAVSTSPRPRASRRSGRGGLVKGLIVAAAVVGIAVAGTIVAWPYLSQLKKPDQRVAESNESGRKDDDGSRNSRKTDNRDSELDLPVGPPKTSKKTDLPRTDLPRTDPTKKTEPTKKAEPTKKNDPPKVDLPVKSGPLPRRALAISINDYLFANPIHYGMPGRIGTNPQTLLDRLTQASALHIPADQVALLSDMAPDRVAQPPTEEAIRNTITSFLDTSRKQDRIILLIIGHVIEIGGEPALLPIDGLTDGKDAGIPLKWIYEQLAACQARQKVLILDTCRYDPSKGQERPGSGPMGAKLDAMLKAPPPGVQVWSSCLAEQYSYEFEGGKINTGMFLEALVETVSNISEGRIQTATDAIPVERWKNAVNASMQEELGKLKLVQTSRLAGSELEQGAPPDAGEKAPPKPKIAPAGKSAIKPADLTLVRSILKDISFPPLKVAQDQKPLTAEALPPFPADALADYAKDDGAPTPLRAEIQKAREVFVEIAKSQLQTSYLVEPEMQLKAKVTTKQKEVAKLLLKLQEANESLKEKEMVQFRKKETKRWQANYDYVTARLEAQIAYLNEYEAVLGQIQKGLAPPDPALYKGWRLASQYDAQTGDSASKKLGNDSRKRMDKIIEAYPNTPWALLARRDRSSGLGLEWQPWVGK